MPDQVGEQLRQLVALQPRELDPARALRPLELGQQRAQRMAAVQLVGAVGGDDEDRLVGQRGGQEAQERPRGRVGPVQVLDHEQDGRLAGQRVEQREQRLEHARLVVAAVARPALAEAGQQRGELRAHGRRELLQHRVAVARELAQGGDERRVGELALGELHAVAAQHAHAALAGAAGELADQAGLADAGLPRHEGQRRAPVGRLEQGALELRELPLAAHEAAGGHADGHAHRIAGAAAPDRRATPAGALALLRRRS